MTLLNKILAGFVTALLIVIAIFWFINARQRADLAEERMANAAYVSENNRCKGRLQVQKEAITQLQEAAESRAAAAQKAVTEAKKRGQRYVDSAGKIERQEAVGDLCGAADKLMTDYLKGQR